MILYFQIPLLSLLWSFFSHFAVFLDCSLCSLFSCFFPILELSWNLFLQVTFLLNTEIIFRGRSLWPAKKYSNQPFETPFTLCWSCPVMMAFTVGLNNCCIELHLAIQEEWTSWVLHIKMNDFENLSYVKNYFVQETSERNLKTPANFFFIWLSKRPTPVLHFCKCMPF